MDFSTVCRMHLLMPAISVAHDDPRRNDRAKEYTMSWLTLLGMAASVSSSASQVGGAVAGMAAQDLGDVFTNPSLNPAKSTEGIATVASLTTVGAATVWAGSAGVAATAAQEAATQAANALANAVIANPTAAANAALATQSQTAATAAADAKTKAEGRVWETPILDACLIYHLSLSTLNGFNTPDEGDKLDPAAHLLDDAAEDLTMAANTTGWTGEEGEPEYTEKNKAQIARVTAMADIDRRFKAALTTQAEQVQGVKDQFSYVTAALAILKPIYGLASTYNKPASLAAQAATFAATILTDSNLQGWHHPKAIATGNVLQGLATEYQDLYSNLPTPTA